MDNDIRSSTGATLKKLNLNKKLKNKHHFFNHLLSYLAGGMKAYYC